MSRILLSLALFSTFVYGASFDDLTPYTLGFIANRTFPGAQLSVISSGGVVHYQKVFGNLTYPGDPFSTPVTDDTLYDIASLSKVVATTSCAMKLYEQGLLGLDDLWVKYVPEANNNGKGAITIRNLLLHNAGFTEDYPFDATYDNVDRQGLMDWVCTTSLIYPVGTKYIYSDVSMVALQMVIERITRQTLYSYAKANIFEPLGMTSTQYIPSKYSSCAPATAAPNYRKQIIRCVVHDPTAWILGGVSGNAGVFTNHLDLQLFMTMMLQKGAYKAPSGSQQRMFQQSTVELFTTAPQNLPYLNSRALGWDTIPNQYPSPCGQKFTPGQSFGHTGYTGTTLWGDFARDIAFIAITNRVYPDDGLTVPTKTGISWYRNNLANTIVDIITSPSEFLE